jgi:HD superfamily phosphohydrolase
LPRGELGKALKELKILDEVVEILTENQAPRWRQEFFSGTVCADLLDYLARDSYYCGLSQRYDKRILSAFRVDEGGDIYLNASKAGLVRHDVISEVIHLLRIRYFLSERVYFHHTKTASGAMISRAVEEALHQGLQLSDLEKLGDETLLYRLAHDFGQVPVIADLIDHLRAHRIYKQTYVLTRQVGEARRAELVERYHLSPAQRQLAEKELTTSLRLREGQLILYCPAWGMQLKEAQVKIKIDDGPPRLLSSLGLPELETLKERHQDLWRLYVFTDPKLENKALKIAQACERFFGEANHLPALRGGQLYFQF